MLMDKARKAYFKIKKTVGLDNSCGLLEKPFDSLVSPNPVICHNMVAKYGDLNASSKIQILPKNST
jgi:hypothetical protein